MKQTRSLTVVAALLSIVAFAVELQAQSKELKMIRLNVFRIDAATVAARVHGYFAAEGLDVEVTETASSTEQMRGVSQGKYQIISGGFDNVLAWSGRESAEIVAVA